MTAITKYWKPNTKQELEEDSDHESIFDQDDINLSIRRINYGDRPEFIRGLWTFFACKNPTSFAIGTDDHGLLVIENLVKIYSQRFAGDENRLKSIIYIDNLDCYLLHCNNRIYRKDVDTHPPYLFIDVIF